MLAHATGVQFARKALCHKNLVVLPEAGCVYGIGSAGGFHPFRENGAGFVGRESRLFLAFYLS